LSPPPPPAAQIDDAWRSNTSHEGYSTRVGGAIRGPRPTQSVNDWHGETRENIATDRTPARYHRGRRPAPILRAILAISNGRSFQPIAICEIAVLRQLGQTSISYRRESVCAAATRWGLPFASVALHVHAPDGMVNIDGYRPYPAPIRTSPAFRPAPQHCGPLPHMPVSILRPKPSAQSVTGTSRPAGFEVRPRRPPPSLYSLRILSRRPRDDFSILNSATAARRAHRRCAQHRPRSYRPRGTFPPLGELAFPVRRPFASHLWPGPWRPLSCKVLP